MIPNKLKINIVTLGCSKNLVDSETLMGKFKVHEIEILHNSPIYSAPIAIINTCGFILDAKTESINTILEFIEAKKTKKIEKVFVIGCLSERYRSELTDEIPEVDGFFGVKELDKVVQQIKSDWKSIPSQRVLSTPKHYAYLKISEGCDRKCSFCAIPLIRGKHQSVPTEDLVAESEILIKNGVKELILIAQDLSSYGNDIYGEIRLSELISKIALLPGLNWVRLHYAYPANFPMKVLDVIANYPTVCRYIDIPIQHINDVVLSNMRRGLNKNKTIELLNQIREKVPEIHIRTTIMVGHPGETEEAFDELLNFIKDFKFEKLGAFTYSEEDDTWGKTNLQDTIPEEVKQQRLGQLMDLQAEISLSLNTNRIGKIYQVLIDRREGEYFIGRSEFESPEVDGEILIPYNKNIRKGNFYKVLITECEAFDLFGEIQE